MPGQVTGDILRMGNLVTEINRSFWNDRQLSEARRLVLQGRCEGLGEKVEDAGININLFRMVIQVGSVNYPVCFINLHKKHSLFGTVSIIY